LQQLREEQTPHLQDYFGLPPYLEFGSYALIRNDNDATFVRQLREGDPKTCHVFEKNDQIYLKMIDVIFVATGCNDPPPEYKAFIVRAASSPSPPPPPIASLPPPKCFALTSTEDTEARRPDIPVLNERVRAKNVFDITAVRSLTANISWK